ncbi:hypothetical protein ACIRBY_37045 [Streptomyces sp. NPDC096136]|uniref:hypothetical protein n=1 Tax=Streptomyces sp. NPDC096136 TaxID=3366076 RepID=UPI003811EA4C
MASPDQVPAWPLYELRAADDGTVTLTGPVIRDGTHPGRREAIEAVARIASTHLKPPRAVRAEAIDPDGTVWPLIIDPDGEAIEAGPARQPNAGRRRKKKTAAVSAHQPPPQGPAHDDPPAAMNVPALEPRTPQRLVPDPRQHAETPQPHPSANDAHSPGPEASQTPPPAPPAAPAAASQQPDDSAAATYTRIRHLAEAGRLDDARSLAAALDDAMSRAHGPSHHEALKAREVLAHIAAEGGDTAGAIHLYRDVAERWWHKGLHHEAEQAACRAHSLWLRIADPDQAITAGQAVIRMRTQIPGEDARAYRQAARYMERLVAAQAARS